MTTHFSLVVNNRGCDQGLMGVENAYNYMAGVLCFFINDFNVLANISNNLPKNALHTSVPTFNIVLKKVENSYALLTIVIGIKMNPCLYGLFIISFLSLTEYVQFYC